MLAAVSGAARRLLHPSELCDHVIVPSHEHLRGLRFPLADVLASFFTLFGLTGLLLFGLTSLSPANVVAISAGAGLVGIIFLRMWLSRICDPCEQLESDLQAVKVVRAIPANGYGQVEVSIEGRNLKLAARSEQNHPIPVGALVEILDQQESVVVVKPRRH